MTKKKYGYWQLDRAPSSHLIKELRKRHGDGVFLNEDAYDAYWDVCYTYKNRVRDFAKEVAVKVDNWMQMNCRNQLCQAASQGIIFRVAPGVYMFTD